MRCLLAHFVQRSLVSSRGEHIQSLQTGNIKVQEDSVMHFIFSHNLLLLLLKTGTKQLNAILNMMNDIFLELLTICQDSGYALKSVFVP